MGIRSGQDKIWNAKRVSFIGRVNNIHGYLCADKDSPWRTMSEAARELGVTNHVIRRLIKVGILPAKQVVDGAPYQIITEDLHSEECYVGNQLKQAPVSQRRRPTASIFTST